MHKQYTSSKPYVSTDEAESVSIIRSNDDVPTTVAPRIDFTTAVEYGIERAVQRATDTWLVSFNNIENALDFYLSLNNNLNEAAIREIYNVESEAVATHLLSKWRACYHNDTHHHDVFRFYASLDQLNRRRLVAWYNRKCLNM